MRRRLLQLAILLVLLAALGLLVTTTAANLRERGIQSGFDFLLQPAGFGIGEGVLSFDAGDSYARAFAAGLANTLRVAIPAAALALLLGAAAGIGRLAVNPLLRGLCALAVESFRNVPLLLQLLVWYFVLGDLLPVAGEAANPLPGVYLSKSGLALPWPTDGGIDWPRRDDFGISGGAYLTPEYLALLCGLACYTAAYVAEVVRGGVLSVRRGQGEAALALGLSRWQSLRLVILPQALRLMVPPLSNQLLNLIKNSSLGVAIGYPELVSVGNTSLNQTGRALECLALVVAVYLALSLLASALMRHWARRETAWH